MSLVAQKLVVGGLAKLNFSQSILDMKIKVIMVHMQVKSKALLGLRGRYIFEFLTFMD